MKTLEQVKDEVCQKWGHRDFRAFKIKCLRMANPLHDMIPMMDEIARTYANEMIKHIKGI